MLSLVSHIQPSLHAVAQIILLVLRSALAIWMAGTYAGKHKIKTKHNSSLVSAILISKSDQIFYLPVLGSDLELKLTCSRCGCSDLFVKLLLQIEIKSVEQYIFHTTSTCCSQSLPEALCKPDHCPGITDGFSVCAVRQEAFRNERHPGGGTTTNRLAVMTQSGSCWMLAYWSLLELPVSQPTTDENFDPELEA